MLHWASCVITITSSNTNEQAIRESTEFTYLGIPLRMQVSEESYLGIQVGILVFPYIPKKEDLSALDYKAYMAIMEGKKAAVQRDWKPVEIHCTEYELRVGQSIFGQNIYSVKIIT